MGSYSVDIHKNEREYKNLTLSDKTVVKNLILYRSRIDVAHNAEVNVNIKEAGSILRFNQEIIALYASLDDTIKLCSFKDKQKKLIDLIFEGYTLQDICGMSIGYKKSTTYDLFDRIVNRIVLMNDVLWKESMEIQGYIKS